MTNDTHPSIIPQFEEFPKMARMSREMIVTEKIDGTNAQIFIDGNTFLTGSRSRWITPDNDNFGFSRWAHEHKEELIKLGNGRHFGEWWGSGIQRGYNLPKGEKRFSLFNATRWSDESVRPACCYVVPVLYTGLFSTEVIGTELERLRTFGSVASPGFMKPEGVIAYHVAGNFGLKKTLEKDDVPKSLVK